MLDKQVVLCLGVILYWKLHIHEERKGGVLRRKGVELRGGELCVVHLMDFKLYKFDMWLLENTHASIGPADMCACLVAAALLVGNVLIIWGFIVNIESNYAEKLFFLQRLDAVTAAISP
jgi:hypothetical protein